MPQGPLCPGIILLEQFLLEDILFINQRFNSEPEELAVGIVLAGVPCAGESILRRQGEGSRYSHQAKSVPWYTLLSLWEQGEMKAARKREIAMEVGEEEEGFFFSHLKEVALI